MEALKLLETFVEKIKNHSMSFKTKKDGVNQIISELYKASKTHKGQAKKLEKIVKSSNSPLAACWDKFKQEGMKKKGNRMVPNCVPNNKK